MTESLSKISTQWSEMEFLMEKEGPEALANYLAARYFDILAAKFKKYASQIDELEAYELASDVMFEFIKNNYRGVKRLDRQRGHLRGLFFKIIKARLYRLNKRYKLQENIELYAEESGNTCTDICLDLDVALEKLEQKRSRLYQAFVLFYLEGKSIIEVGEALDIAPSAVKHRLYSARRWLADALCEYREDS